MAVGQGGMHVGAMRRMGGCPFDLLDCGGVERFGSADFLYVYDCGSEPKRHAYREVKALVGACPSHRLDMLFLSHFDRDHMCGIPRLLRASDGFAVDTIVLPYIETEARIIALARAAAAISDHGGTLDSFFVDMIFDPVGTLARFGPRQIILVRSDNDEGPSDEGVPDLPIDPDPDRPLGAREGGLNWKLKPAFPGDPQRPFAVEVAPSAGRSRVIMVRNAAIIVHDAIWAIVWKLQPYVRAVDPATRAKFRSAVETLFGWNPGTFAARIADPRIREQMVTKRREQMGQVYKASFGNKNLGSLCLYSGPAEPDNVDAICLNPSLARHDLTKIGWVGTGDAHLADPDEIAGFKRAYADDLALVSSFLFPHHGSIENSDPALLVTDADVWIAAADPVRKWKHPHWSLEAAVDRLGREFRHVRSWKETALDECVIVTPKSAQ